MTVGEAKVGDRVDRPPYVGTIRRITEHGTQIGDGSVAWRTFRVQPDDRSYTDTMGPLRVDAEL